MSKFLSLNPLKFVLACETTGGPVTHMHTGFFQGFILDSQSQEVINYEEGIYEHKITVSISSDSSLGFFTFSFRNAVSHKYSSLAMRGK